MALLNIDFELFCCYVAKQFDIQCQFSLCLFPCVFLCLTSIVNICTLLLLICHGRSFGFFNDNRFTNNFVVCIFESSFYILLAVDTRINTFFSHSLDLSVFCHVLFYISVDNAQSVRFIIVEVSLALEKGKQSVEKYFNALTSLYRIHENTIKPCVFSLTTLHHFYF